MTTVTSIGTLIYNGTSVSSRVLTLSAGAAVGERVIVLTNGIGATGAITAITITDSKSNTWAVRAGPQAQAAANTNAQLGISSSTISTALVASDTITITMTSANPNRYLVQVVKIDDATGFDVAGSTAGATSTSLGVACSSASSQADQIAIAAFGYTNQTTTLTPAAGWSSFTALDVDNGTNVRSMKVLYQLFSTSGTRTANATLTAGGSQAYAGVIGAWNTPTSALPYEFARKDSGGTWIPQDLQRM